MVTLASPAVGLYLHAITRDPSSALQAAGGPFELPSNVPVSAPLRQVTIDLLARSRTLREQCAKIAAARQVQVIIDTVAPSAFGGQMRARSTARRYESGPLIVIIELPVSSDLAELLAHELEHVTEFIEQVDLPAMAREGRGGVTQRKRDGAFESQRAIAAGRAAADETDGGADPVAVAVVHAFSTGARAAWRTITNH
ncbi:MAG: hypothetical protein ABI818_14535 [Acidobacteriota bacterium]